MTAEQCCSGRWVTGERKTEWHEHVNYSKQIIYTTLIIHHSLTLSLLAHNLPVLPTNSSHSTLATDTWLGTITVSSELHRSFLLVSFSVRWPCGVCGRGTGNNSIQCTRCQKWVYGKCSGIKGSMYKVIKTFVWRGCVNPVTGTMHKCRYCC